MRKPVIILLCIVVLFSTTYLAADTSNDVSGQPVSSEKTAYNVSTPFRINSNAEFAAMASAKGWPGDGSQATPYIIDNYVINGAGYGYCIYVGNTTCNFTVKNCYLHHAGGVGSPPYYSDANVILYNVRNALLKNSTMSLSSSGSGIYVNTCSGNNITNNSVLSNQVGIYLFHSNITTVSYNSASSNYYGIYIYSANNNNITSNTLLSTNRNIFLYSSSTYNNIDNNTASNGEYSIYLLSSPGNTITNNTVSNNWYSIFLQSSSNNNLTGNIATNSYYGIRLEVSSSNNNLTGNIATDNSIGIGVYNSNNNNLTGNNASINTLEGILISSSYNNIRGNTVFSNTDNGIYLAGANYNVIINNTLLLNNDGIDIFSSFNNWIYHNNFINNLNQARDNLTTNNIYNATYPIGGNYWSDYAGIDVKSGPLQNLPGSDGIGDTPYTNIFGWPGCQDKYPLMSPFDYTEFNIPLQQGWNLISLPLRQLNESIDSVLESIAGKWDCIQTYDASDISDHWKSNLTYRPVSLNDLTTMNHLKGYWINITEPGVTLTVKGDKFGSALSIPLKAGWNLVGYPTLNTTTTVENAFWGTGADNVEVCDPTDPYRTKEVGSTYLMKPGEGYWVHVPADIVWLVNW